MCRGWLTAPLYYTSDSAHMCRSQEFRLGSQEELRSIGIRALYVDSSSTRQLPNLTNKLVEGSRAGLSVGSDRGYGGGVVDGKARFALLLTLETWIYSHHSHKPSPYWGNSAMYAELLRGCCQFQVVNLRVEWLGISTGRAEVGDKSPVKKVMKVAGGRNN